MVEFKDYVYGTTRVALEHLSLYLLVMPPPPKELWISMERGMNALIKQERIQPEDATVILEGRNQYKPQAQEVLEKLNSQRVMEMNSDSEEFQALIYFYILDMMSSLYEAYVTDKQDHALAALANVNDTLHYLHKVAEPTLQRMVMKGITGS